MKKAFWSISCICLLFGCIPKRPSQPNPVTVTEREADADNDSSPSGRLAWQKPELVISKLGDINGKVIADIGAGTGFFSFRLMNKGAKVIAVDIDRDMLALIEVFRENLDGPEIQDRMEPRLATPSDANLDPEEVDIVVIINTIGFIKDRLTYLKDLRGSIKPEGKIMIVDFKMKLIAPEIAPPPSERVILLTLEEELLEAGYHLTSTDDTSLDYQYVVMAEL